MGDTPNNALRDLLDEVGMSNAALARAVVTAGARDGFNMGTDTTSVKRMLNGTQPRWPVPRLVATVLAQRLQREVGIADCGFTEREPDSGDPCDGLLCSGTLEDTLRTIVTLSGRDMRRRKLLLGSVFTAAAFAEPALLALTAPPAEATARTGGRRVGMTDVEVLTEQTNHLSRLGSRYGSGRVRDQVVTLLHREANQLLHGSYSERTGKALLRAVAHTARVAGFMSADDGRDALAQRYYVQALDLAMRAGDRLHAAKVLATMSRMTAQLGENAPAEDNVFRRGRQAVALSRAGLTVMRDSALPALAAELHALEGRGLALLDDADAARRAVLSAQRQHEAARPDHESPWQDTYTERVLFADLGTSLRRIGETKQALTFGVVALQSCESWHVRGRSLAQANVALTHLLGRDLEQAASYGREAVRTATDIRSTTTRQRLGTLQRRLAPLRAGSPHLRDLDERITTVLARRAAR